MELLWNATEFASVDMPCTLGGRIRGWCRSRGLGISCANGRLKATLSPASIPLSIAHNTVTVQMLVVCYHVLTDSARALLLWKRSREGAFRVAVRCRDSRAINRVAGWAGVRPKSEDGKYVREGSPPKSHIPTTTAPSVGGPQNSETETGTVPTSMRRASAHTPNDR